MPYANSPFFARSKLTSSKKHPKAAQSGANPDGLTPERKGDCSHNPRGKRLLPDESASCGKFHQKDGHAV